MHREHLSQLEAQGLADERRYTTVTESELADHFAIKRAISELDSARWYVANGHDPSLHIANAKKLLSQLNG